ncbi:phiKZ-like phage internal head protein [compost metagenome]
MSVAEFNQVRRDVDHMFKLSCALEAYSDLLNGDDVSLDSAEGRAISFGLESIDPSIDLKEGSFITMRVIKEGIIKVAKATREVVRLLFEVLGNLYVKFTGSLGRVRGHQKNVAKRLGRLGSRVSYKQMEISGINRLSVNGTFVGDDPNTLVAIRVVSDFLLNKHPAMVVKVARVCSRRFIDLVEGQADATSASVAQAGMGVFIETLQAAMHPIAGEQPVKAGELPQSFAAGRYNRSEVMPGNWALIYTALAEALRDSGTLKLDLYANVIKQAFKIDFLELTMNTADRTARTVDVPSVQVLGQLVDGISKILDVAEKSETGRRDFSSVKVVVDDAIRQVMDVRTGDGKANGTVIQMLGSLSETLAAPMGNFTHWVAVTLNIYLNYIDHCIKHYEVEGV